ncbi:type II RES/Xre toxin-antitoxin system antitoxin [Vibrio sp. RC27]
MYSTAYQSLGGKKSDMSNVAQSLAMIRNGLPVSVLDNGTEQLGVTKQEYALLIGENLRNIQRKTKANGKLSSASSEHVLMLAELVNQCDKYFGDTEKRKRWFQRPNVSLGNVTPISICDTVTGIKLVSETITKLTYGFSA